MEFVCYLGDSRANDGLEYFFVNTRLAMGKKIMTVSCSYLI